MHGLCIAMSTTAEQEQAWNAAQLSEPVTAPRFAIWTYAQPAIVLAVRSASG